MSRSLLLKFELFAPSARAAWQQQSVRHRGKINLKFPRPRHEIARYLEEITRPVLIKELPDPVESCVQAKSKVASILKFTTNEAIDFERFLARHALSLIESYKCMIICHKLDCSGEVLRRNKVEFKKLGAVGWDFNTVIMNLLIENNPKFQNLQPIVNTGLGRNYYLFVKEENLKKLLTLLRRMPHLNVLGALVNDRLYTRSGIQDYVKLADLGLEMARSQLCSTLNQQLASITSTLSTPAQNLAQTLNHISKSEKKD